MKSPAATIACNVITVAAVVVIIVTPAPGAAKLLALSFIVAGLLCILVDATLTARAQIAAVTERDAKVIAWLGDLKVERDAEQAAWEQWLGQAPGFDAPPLASVTPLPNRARVLRMPTQRKASE